MSLAGARTRRREASAKRRLCRRAHAGRPDPASSVAPVSLWIRRRPASLSRNDQRTPAGAALLPAVRTALLLGARRSARLARRLALLLRVAHLRAVVVVALAGLGHAFLVAAGFGRSTRPCRRLLGRAAR